MRYVPTVRNRLFVMPLALVMAFSVSACGSPTEPSLSGTWRGTAQDNIGGSGTFEVTLAQTSSNISGTWLIAFPSNPALDNGGSLSGTISGSSLSATLSPSNPNGCPFNLTATVSGTVLSGTYASFNCVIAITGSFNATKQ